MSTMTLEELSSRLRKIDFCLLCTQREDGRMATRPMSNNGDVEYDGGLLVLFVCRHQQGSTD